jgi:hypothetical protein
MAKFISQEYHPFPMAMVGAKRMAVPLSELPGFVRACWDGGYDRISIFLPGSREHSKEGLAEDRALVRMWRTKRP